MKNYLRTYWCITAVVVLFFTRFPSPALAGELLFCQPEKGKGYLAMFYLPSAVGEMPQAKLFTGWEIPYKPDHPAQCFEPSAAQLATNTVAYCGVQYGPDGGQSLYLRKPTKPSDPYILTLTAEGPTGPGARQTMTCE